MCVLFIFFSASVGFYLSYHLPVPDYMLSCFRSWETKQEIKSRQGGKKALPDLLRQFQTAFRQWSVHILSSFSSLSAKRDPAVVPALRGGGGIDREKELSCYWSSEENFILFTHTLLVKKYSHFELDRRTRLSFSAEIFPFYVFDAHMLMTLPPIPSWEVRNRSRERNENEIQSILLLFDTNTTFSPGDPWHSWSQGTAETNSIVWGPQ